MAFYAAPVRVPVSTLTTPSCMLPCHGNHFQPSCLLRLCRNSKPRSTGKRTVSDASISFHRRTKPPAITWPGTIRSSRNKRLNHSISRSEVNIPSGTHSYFLNSNLLLSVPISQRTLHSFCTDGKIRTSTHLSFFALSRLLRHCRHLRSSLIPKSAALCQLHRYHPCPSSFRSVIPGAGCSLGRFSLCSLMSVGFHLAQ